MQAGEMIHHVPISAISRFGTAAGINHAAETVVADAFGLVNLSAACQPARSWRRRCVADVPAENKFHYRWRKIDHLHLLTIRSQLRAGRKRGRIHTHGVRAEFLDCKSSYAEIIGVRDRKSV